ncbi:MAG: TonB-dependent receptor [Pseudomonadota bacterium]
MQHNHTLLASTFLAAAYTGVMLAPAMAQDDEGFVEEIVVAATKRNQSIQEVPIAVSSYSADQLLRAGITDVRELTQLSPSLFLSSSTSEVAGAVARIRGIGTTGDNPGLESSVAVFIDGVYRNRTNVGLTELGALDRIEVLRGPQGTLFGRNASAGLINVVTANPEFDASGYGELSYGNFEFVRAAAGLTGALVEDKVAARIDGVFTSRDGFFTDATSGEDLNDRNRYLIRGKLLAEFESGSVLLSADYANRDENCCAAATIVRGEPSATIIEAIGGRLASGGTPPGSDPFDRIAALSPGRSLQQDVEEYGVSAEVNWDFDRFNVVSITAYREWDASRGQDIDYTAADLFFRDQDGSTQSFETFTQEIRFNGQAGIIDWMVGGFYSNEDLTYVDAIRLGRDFEAFANLGATGGASAALPYGNASAFLASQGAAAFIPLLPGQFGLTDGDGVLEDRFAQNSENWSLFTHNIVDVTDIIDITIGLRYTEDVKTLDASVRSDNQACTDVLDFLATEIPVSPTATASVAAAAGGAFNVLATAPCAAFFNPVVDGDYDGRRKETEFTGTFAVNFKWTDDFSTYASYSRGYKAGGFNLDRAALDQGLSIAASAAVLAVPYFGASPNADNDLQFAQETVDSFEAGLRYRDRDRNFNVNATVFYASFNDFQLNTFDGASFVVNNLAEVENYGFEIDGTWQPKDDLTFNGGITYAVAEYTEDLPMGPGELFEQPSAANPNPFSGAFFQLPGSQITNAPKWSISGSTSYQPEITSALKALFYIDGRYTSAINTGSDLDQEKIQDGFVLFNGRVGVGDIDDGWRVEFFMRNIFDKEYLQIAFDQALQGSGTAANTFIPTTQSFGSFLGEPRTYGVNARINF